MRLADEVKVLHCLEGGCTTNCPGAYPCAVCIILIGHTHAIQHFPPLSTFLAHNPVTNKVSMRQITHQALLYLIELVSNDPDCEGSLELLKAAHHTTCPMSLMTSYTSNLPDGKNTTSDLTSYMSSEAMQHKAAWEAYTNRLEPKVDPTQNGKPKRQEAKDDGDKAEGSRKKIPLRQKGNGKGHGKGRGRETKPAYTQKGQSKGQQYEYPQDEPWWEPWEPSNQARAQRPSQSRGNGQWHYVTWKKPQEQHHHNNHDGGDRADRNNCYREGYNQYPDEIPNKKRLEPSQVSEEANQTLKRPKVHSN